MYHINGVFIIPEQDKNSITYIAHTVKKPEECIIIFIIIYFIATESYMKCESTYYYGKKDATDDNNVMIYTNTKFPFLNTLYLNGSLHVKTGIYYIILL